MKEITAIKNTLDLWKWLADNPDLHKEDYPKFTKIIQPCLSLCPCCEYYRKRGPINYRTINSCVGCPLKPKRIIEGKICSPHYHKWAVLTSYQTKQKAINALAIYYILEKRYEKLIKADYYDKNI